jgi:hypothetical protein
LPTEELTEIYFTPTHNAMVWKPEKIVFGYWCVNV